MSCYQTKQRTRAKQTTSIQNRMAKLYSAHRCFLIHNGSLVGGSWQDSAQFSLPKVRDLKEVLLGLPINVPKPEWNGGDRVTVLSRISVILNETHWCASRIRDYG